MQEQKLIDYGPLAVLVGTWEGNKGKDLAPEPDGTEHNEYYETIVFTEAVDLANAEEERLSAVHYTQKVKRISNNKIIHQETGYWMWQQGTDKVMHSLTIPRGICVLAGGTSSQQENTTIFSVAASLDNEQCPIIQSCFLVQKAKTKSYKQQLQVSGNTLQYQQNMLLDIYGREFDHNDKNTLTKIK